MSFGIDDQPQSRDGRRRTEDEGQEFATAVHALEAYTGHRRGKAFARQVADDDGTTGRNDFGGHDRLAEDAAVEHVADDFKHW